MAFMVICLHVQLFYSNEWSLSNGLLDVFVIYLCKVICPVAVPMFFFISGYLFFKGLENWNYELWKGKMIKRVRTLLIPYFLWNLIAILAFPVIRLGGALLNGSPIDDLWAVVEDRGFIRLFWDRTLFDGNIQNTTNMLGWRVPCGQPTNTPMWFVRDLMVVLLFSPLIHKLIDKGKFAFIILLAGLYIVNIWIPISGFSIRSVFFFSWGAYYSLHGFYIVESFRKIKWPIGLLFILGLSLIPMFWSNNSVFPILVRLFTIVSLVFVFNVASYLIEKEKVAVNANLARSSFFVYCSHMVIIISVVMWVVMALPFHSGLMQTLLFIAATILVYAICHCIYLFMNKFMPKVLAVLTGGRAVTAKKTIDK